MQGFKKTFNEEAKNQQDIENIIPKEMREKSEDIKLQYARLYVICVLCINFTFQTINFFRTKDPVAPIIQGIIWLIWSMSFFPMLCSYKQISAMKPAIFFL